MPGPMSAPNGDSSLTVFSQFACTAHGTNRKFCSQAKAEGKNVCRNISKREFLLRANKLSTGKTFRK